MKVLSCQLENFASYKSLDFQFDGQGLTLIQGPTGAGKSTLCDAIPWVLFGTTAKGGAVDEVISWPGTDTTRGNVILVIAGRHLTVVRTRGNTAKQNDLYFQAENGVHKRGADARDTQRLLNEHLGLDADLYLAGAYFHEFSKLAQFFTTTAKNRKDICEQIVDLTLAKNLQAKTSESTKTLNKSYTNVAQQLLSAERQHQLLLRLADQERGKRDSWQAIQDKKTQQTFIDQADKIKKLNEMLPQVEKLIDASNRIDSIIKNHKPENCMECGAPKHHKKLAELKQKQHEIDKDLTRKATLVEQLEKEVLMQPLELSSINPHEGSVLSLEADLAQEADIVKSLKALEGKTKLKLDDLDLLNDVVKDFRGTIIKNTLLELEQKTNAFLSDYFDAEIKATFSIEDADKIEVAITKDGNNCAYTQLSKGQRCMLKLAFGISVMQTVQNHQGIEFNAVFFDEALDGCDDVTKAKALRLLESLTTTYSSVFLVEHSEAIKASVDNKYSVALINGSSIIAKT